MFRERYGRKVLLRGTRFPDNIRRWAISTPISSGAAAGSVLRYVWRCGPKSILDGFNPPPTVSKLNLSMILNGNLFCRVRSSRVVVRRSRSTHDNAADELVQRATSKAPTKIRT